MIRKEEIVNNCTLNIGTHNGIFHCDESAAIAIIKIAYAEKTVHVIRTEKIEDLRRLDIVVDIGGGSYDHHMPGFNECRISGEKYASAGLIWRDFGERTIRNIANEQGIIIDNLDVQKIKAQIDEEIIIPIDKEDNGIECDNHTFSFVSKLLPTWLEIPQDFDTAFDKVVSLIFDILKGIIKSKVVQIATEPYLEKIYKCSNNNGILEIPSQTMEWIEHIVNHNEKNGYEIKFVIFPYPRGGWAAQCVPPSIDNKFKQLVPFPKEWAGGDRNTLPKISGIQDAITCHNGRFFARAETKESIIKMCNIAINSR